MNNVLKIIFISFALSCSLFGMDQVCPKRLPFVLDICNTLRDDPKLSNLKKAQRLLKPYIASLENGEIPAFIAEEQDTITDLSDDINRMIKMGQAQHFLKKNSDHQYDAKILKLLEPIIPALDVEENESQVEALSIRADLFYNRDDSLTEDEASLFEHDLKRLMNQSLLIDTKFSALSRLFCLSIDDESKKVKIQERAQTPDFFEAIIDSIIEVLPHKHQECRNIVGARLDIILSIIAGNRKALAGVGAHLIGDMANLAPFATKKNRAQLKLNIVYRLLKRVETKIDTQQEWVIGAMLDFLEPSLKDIQGSPRVLARINTLFSRLTKRCESSSEVEAALKKTQKFYEEFDKRRDLQSLDALVSYLAPFKKSFQEGTVTEGYEAAWKKIFERISLTRIKFLLDEKPSKKRDKEILAEIEGNCINTDWHMLTDQDIEWLIVRSTFLSGRQRLTRQQEVIFVENTRALAQQNRKLDSKLVAIELLNSFDDPHDKALGQQLLRSGKFCELVLKGIYDQLRPFASLSLRLCSYDIPKLYTHLEESIMMIDGGHTRFRIGSMLLDNLSPLLIPLRQRNFIQFQLEALNMLLDRARQLLHSEYKNVIPSVCALVESRIEALKNEASIDKFMLQQVLTRFNVLSALITQDADKIVEAETALEKLQRALARNKSIRTQEKLRFRYMVILLQKAWLLEAQGKKKLAGKLFVKIINNCKGNHKGMAYLQYGLFLKKQGDYKQAVNALDKALALVDTKQTDQKILLLAQRGLINYAWDKKDAARVDFEGAYATPRLYGYYSYVTKLALAELYQHEYPLKSIEFYQDIVIHSDGVFATRARVALAEFHCNEGRYQEAKDFAQQALEKLDEGTPLYFRAVAICGYSLCKQQEFSESADYLLALEEDLDQLNEPWKTNVANALLGYYITKFEFDQARELLGTMEQANINCDLISIALKKALLLIDSSPKQSLKILNRIIHDKTSSALYRARAAYYAYVCYQKINKHDKAVEMRKLFLKNSRDLELYERVLLDRIAYVYLIHPKEHLKPQEISLCKEMLEQCTPRTMRELDECALDRFHRSDRVTHYATIFKKLDMIEPETENDNAREQSTGVDQKFSNLKDYLEYIYQISILHTDGHIDGYKKQSTELKKASLKRRVRVNKMNFNELLPLFGMRCSQKNAHERLMQCAKVESYTEFCVTIKTLGIRLAGLRELSSLRMNR